jgi:hypothetical protein
MTASKDSARTTIPASPCSGTRKGLGHNGERTGGVHTVWFVNGSSEPIAVDHWDAFLAEQEALQMKVKR